MRSCSSCRGKFKKVKGREGLHPWKGMLLCGDCYRSAISRHGRG